MSNEQGNIVARALVEALPYVQRWSGHVVVIKVGGSTMKEASSIDQIAQDLVLLRAVGVDVVLVHGGGAEVTKVSQSLGLESEFIDGLRVTSEDTMRVAQLVQIGGISRDILAAVARHGGMAVGLSGHDGGGWMRGELRKHVSKKTGKPVDLGRVGDITSVNTSLISAQMREGLIPVISPVAVDDEMKALNVNADTVATAIAGALNAKRLLFLTDVKGIHGPDGLASYVETDTLRQWIDDDVVSGGMVPKVEACLQAIDSGVERVSVIDGRLTHASLIELLTRAGTGTLVQRPEVEA